MIDPSADALKVAVDELNKAVGQYVASNTEFAMAEAKVARMLVHGGIDKIVSQRDLMLATLKEVEKMIDQALPKFNWGASFLDADAIGLLNTTPPLVRRVIQQVEGTKQEAA